MHVAISSRVYHPLSSQWFDNDMAYQIFFYRNLHLPKLCKLTFSSLRYRWPKPVLAILFRTFGTKDIWMICFSNISDLSVPGEGNYRNASGALNSISTFLLSLFTSFDGSRSSSVTHSWSCSNYSSLITHWSTDRQICLRFGGKIKVLIVSN